MAFFRQYIAPFLIVLVFLVALLAVSSRIFLPDDLMAPAPIGQITPKPSAPVADLPRSLSDLVNGLPDDPALVE